MIRHETQNELHVSEFLRQASYQRRETMELKPGNKRLGPKPGRRERRRIRATAEYRYVRESLGTTDAETLLLLRIGDVMIAQAGQDITGEEWTRYHMVIGLSTRLAVGDYTQVTAPWMIDHDSEGAPISVAKTGLVLFIDRRHRHLADAALAGRVEPVAPIAKAVAQRPARPAVTSNRRSRNPVGTR